MAELLSRVSSRELSEWAAFEREYGPLGPERGDWQAALVAHVVAGASGGKRTKISDFLIRWANRPKRQSSDDVLTVFRALASQRGARGNDS